MLRDSAAIRGVRHGVVSCPDPTQRVGSGHETSHGAPRRTRFRNPLDHVDFGFQNGFLDFKVDFWISVWISGFQFGFLPTVYEISFATDPSLLATVYLVEQNH